MRRIIFQFFTVAVCAVYSINLAAQTDTTYHVALILPFQAESTTGKLNEIANARDLYTANRVHFNEDALISLDFYQGVTTALNEGHDNIKLQVNVYDCGNSDSLTAELLKKPELKKMDFVIGAVSTPNSKLVAEFCKANKILNIQPFTPSKSLTTENQYHVKLAPTIDAHIDNLFQSILDSFPDANIIIYTPKNERSLPLAQHYDSLFRAYNKTEQKKYNVSLLNTSDMQVNGRKTTLDELVNHSKANILIITSYDEPFIQSTLRTVFEKSERANIIVYGLPTWLSGDVLRLDYINDLHTRISDAFWMDTVKEKGKDFMRNYTINYNSEPSRYAFLGYDVMSFMLQSVKNYGKDFLSQIITQRYTGIGYKFDITRTMKNEDTINYYENTHVNILKVEDYSLHKIW